MNMLMCEMTKIVSFASYEERTRQNPPCPRSGGAAGVGHHITITHYTVLRPAWGSLQLFRAIKLNKMAPRCDHSAHSDHSVPSVPCTWSCSTLAPGLAPHSSWPAPFISINILLATGIAQFWLLMNSNYAFVGQPALNCILYILIFGAKNTIFRNLKGLLERFQI